MLDRNYLTGLRAIAWMAAGIYALLALNAWGGVDIEVYWREAYFADFSLPRYFQEPLSWTLIKFISATVSRELFLPAFVCFILALCILKLGLTGGSILYAALFSPFGVLLQLNVLRQCLATIFLSFMVVSLLNEKSRVALFWGALAVICHNSSVLFVIMVFLTQFYKTMRPGNKFISFIFGLSCIFILQFFGFLETFLGGTEAAFSVDEDLGLVQNFIYVGFAIVSCAAVFFFPGPTRSRPIVVGLLLAVLTALGLSFTFGFDPWVFGRYAISCVVIAHFMFLYGGWHQREISAGRLLSCLLLITMNAVLILFHPGALGMLGD